MRNSTLMVAAALGIFYACSVRVPAALAEKSADGAHAANATPAQDLNWTELAGRPELWPAQCTLQHAVKFEGGVSVSAGQKLNVFQVKPTEAEVGTLDGKTNFTVEPDETDLLTVARAAWVKLTPKQRALTYAAIAQQKELWPAQIILKKTIQLGGGASVHEGEKLPVLEVHPDKLLVKSESLHGTFYVASPATDVMAQARQFVEDPQAGPRFVAAQKQLAEGKRIAEETRSAEEKQRAQVRVISELDGKLINSLTGRPEPFDTRATPRYVVFYRGSSTCPITRRFTPTLIRYYRQMKVQHPEFEIVWMMTESPEDTGKFAKELGFSWRAVTYDDEAKLSSINSAITGKLPQLLVVDQSGKILANGSQESAPAALQQLDALLRRTPMAE